MFHTEKEIDQGQKHGLLFATEVYLLIFAWRYA